LCSSARENAEGDNDRRRRFAWLTLERNERNVLELSHQLLVVLSDAKDAGCIYGDVSFRWSARIKRSADYRGIRMVADKNFVAVRRSSDLNYASSQFRRKLNSEMDLMASRLAGISIITFSLRTSGAPLIVKPRGPFLTRRVPHKIDANFGLKVVI